MTNATLDPLSADMKPLQELLGMLPKRPSPASVWRWMKRGKNGTRLAAMKIGQELYTTADELRRFLTESQAGIKPIDDAAAEAAERELARRYAGSRA